MGVAARWRSICLVVLVFAWGCEDEPGSQPAGSTHVVGDAIGDPSDQRHAESRSNDAEDYEYKPVLLVMQGRQAEPPTGPLVYQPMLLWAGAEPTYNGTGFLARTPEGEVVGVTSAHFFDFSEAKLNAVRWLDMTTGETVATFDRLIGGVGESPVYSDTDWPADTRRDFMIFAGADVPGDLPTLELSTRKRMETFEPVWFPNKKRDAPGYDLLEGELFMSDRDYLLVTIEPAIELRSQSGSPLFSQRSGKVIGLLSGAHEQDGVSYIYFAPAREVVAAMQRPERPALHQLGSE